MITCHQIRDRDQWNGALSGLPTAHALQLWEWGAFKSGWGWSAERRLWQTDDARPAAAAQILRRAIPGLGRSFLYVTKGPALDYRDASLTAHVLADLEAYARKSGALFIKIDPDVILAYGEPADAPPPEATGQAVLNLLTERGWRFSPEQIQFRNTVLIDLTPTAEEILAAMKSKWRYNIRLASRRGVTVRSGTSQDIPLFQRMYAETAARDGFLIRPAAYYRDVWQLFMEAGLAEMLLAEVDGEAVAGLILFFCGPTAWYLYGASTERHRRLMPNHLLQWRAIERAKARGCIRYDLWGAPDVFDETDGMWGVYRFKQGFNGQTVQGLGAFDYPVNRPLYWAFTTALSHLRALWRRMKRG